MPSEVGASLGFGAGGNGKKSGSFGVNSGSSNRDSVWVNDMTKITGANVDIAVAGKTSITGAMIDGDDNLHLTTNELEFKDLHDFERVGETGFGVSTSVGMSTDKGETSLHPNGETSLTLKDTGHDREQITRATIGDGVIEVGGKVVDDAELSGLNRDTTKAQEITKDLTTGTLDATASIDNRVFTSEGRAEIAREHEGLGENVEKVAGDMWNLPNTAIGATIGAIGIMLGANYEYDEENRIHNVIGNPIFHEFSENLGLWATTFGQVVNYFGYEEDYENGIDVVVPTYEYRERSRSKITEHFQLRETFDDKVVLREHENRHVQQYRKWGPFFLPKYLLDNPFTYKNEFEADADKYGNQKYKENFQ